MPLVRRRHRCLGGRPCDGYHPGKTEQAPNQRLEAFKGVRDFPTRTKCASLAWHTLESALEKKNRPTSTE